MNKFRHVIASEAWRSHWFRTVCIRWDCFVSRVLGILAMTNNPPMNFLAIDYGTKNIGLAKASSLVDLVLPFGVIENANTALARKKIADIVVTEKIEKIIIGLPFGLDGSENENTARISEFANNLEQASGAPVEFVNEMFSSQAGDRMGSGVSRDEKAAMVILQSYMAKNN